MNSQSITIALSDSEEIKLYGVKSSLECEVKEMLHSAEKLLKSYSSKTPAAVLEKVRKREFDFDFISDIDTTDTQNACGYFYQSLDDSRKRLYYVALRNYCSHKKSGEFYLSNIGVTTQARIENLWAVSDLNMGIIRSDIILLMKEDFIQQSSLMSAECFADKAKGYFEKFLEAFLTKFGESHVPFTPAAVRAMLEIQKLGLQLNY